MARKKPQNEDLLTQNAAKSLVANIRFSSVDNPVRSIVVTSSVANEGKSTTAIELARAMADLGNRVLLVDCDMRRRSLATMLGVHPRCGLHAVLSGEVELEDAVIASPTTDLFFLDCEPHIPNPDAIVGSARFSSLLEEAHSAYRYIVFDTPPLSAFVDAAVLSTLTDAAILVVAQGLVRRDDLLESYAQLQKAGANVIGAVMNRCPVERDSYYYSHYYGEGQAEQAEPSSEVAHDDPEQPRPAANEPTSSIATEPTPLPAQRGIFGAPGSSSAASAVASPAPSQASATASNSAASVSAPLPASSLRPAPGASIAPDTTTQFLIDSGYLTQSGEPRVRN